MSGWRSQSSSQSGSEVVYGPQNWWHQIIFSLPTTKNVGASGGKKKKLPAAQKRQPEKKLLHKSLWIGATYLWHSGRHRKQHFSKWKSFPIKSSAHGRQNHTPTEGPKSLHALCAISVPGLSLNPVIGCLKKKEKKKNYISTCTVLFKPIMFEGWCKCTS